MHELRTEGQEKGEEVVRDILDGKYTGELLPEEVIEQYRYRGGIHLSYIAKLKEGHTGYLLGLPDIPTAIAFHDWAINGYEWGIKYIQEHNPIREVCTIGQAVQTLFGWFLRILRKK